MNKLTHFYYLWALRRWVEEEATGWTVILSTNPTSTLTSPIGRRMARQKKIARYFSVAWFIAATAITVIVRASRWKLVLFEVHHKGDDPTRTVRFNRHCTAWSIHSHIRYIIISIFGTVMGIWHTAHHYAPYTSWAINIMALILLVKYRALNPEICSRPCRKSMRYLQETIVHIPPIAGMTLKPGQQHNCRPASVSNHL